MTIRFAPSRRAGSSLLARALSGRVTGPSSNDNRDPGEPPIDEVTQAALRHFAEHGLAAARVAYDRAQNARIDGRDEEFEHWQGICLALDRPMANQLKRKQSA